MNGSIGFDERGRCDSPFIDLEDAHSKHGHDPARKGHHDDTHQHRDVFARDSGENLTTSDTVDHAITEIGENIQCTADFAGIVSHEVACDDL